MVKALFFDIDGTLVSFNTHEIPTSTIDALQRVHANGVKIIISTGRPLAIINNLSSISNIIDGYITTNGAYCFVGDTTVYLNGIDKRDVLKMKELSDDEGFACMFVTKDNFTVYNSNQLIRDIYWRLLGLKDLHENVAIDDILQQDILQLTPIITKDREETLMPSLSGCISGRWCDEFCDITAKGTDKGRGIHVMADYLGIRLDETMAFGDGGNDLSMLKTAGIGVAMGNANESIKPFADYITTDIDDNGIANALHHFCLI